MRKLIGIATFILLPLIISGCTPAPEPDPVTSNEKAQSQNQESQVPPTSEYLLIWTTLDFSETLEVVSSQFEEDTGVQVVFEVKDRGSALSELAPAKAEGNGPDIFIGSHDWTGQLVASGFIAPLQAESPYFSELMPNAKAAFSFDSSLYGVPVAMENVGLVCNSKLAPRQPETWNELVNLGFGITLSEGSADPYHLFYLQSSFGSSIFQQNEDGSYLSNLDLGNEAGLDFAAWLSANRSTFEFLDYSAVLQRMSNLELACWITGPWSWDALGESLGEDSLVVYSLPSPGGSEPRPLLDARGFFLSSSAADPHYANLFLEEYLASEAAHVDMLQTTGYLPAHFGALEAANNDSRILGFSKAGARAIPRPNISEMQYVWGPLGNAQAQILSGGEDPRQIWTSMVSEIQLLLPLQ